MQNSWKQYFIRHGLFSYSRDTLMFFVNLFAWSQSNDLRTIALFNIIFLATHTAMFFVLLPLVKNGRGQTIMKTGILGLAFSLVCLLVLQEKTIDYIHLLALVIGFFNGMYWFVNHIESFDISSNASRTSFFSYRMASQGVARLAVPAVGWLVFALMSDSDSGYTAVFGIALITMIASWFLTSIAKREESSIDLRGSLRHMRQTKYFHLLQFNGFVYGISVRSALAAILLPFLIFQVVEKESSLSMIQTAVQVLAVFAAVYFGGHKKNISYINKLFLIGGAATMFGLLALFFSLSLTTYLIYIVTYILALNATNIGISTLSNNYVSTIKDYDEHRIEYIVIRELPSISGFMFGYVFVYFYPSLSIDSLRPLLAFTMIATLTNIAISVYLWQHVQSQDN